MRCALIYDAASDVSIEGTLVDGDGEVMVFSLDRLPAGDRFRLELFSAQGQRDFFEAERVWMIARRGPRVRLALRMKRRMPYEFARQKSFRNGSCVNVMMGMLSR